MKTIKFIIIYILLCSCTKNIEVTSIDQIPGKWNWGSTCGGFTGDTCVYSSKSHYASLEFTSDGNYIEKHNDTIYLQSKFSIIKYDDTFGTLLLDSYNISRSITVLNNRLLISRGELQDSYIKIK
jgi:hypothetical protein